MKIQWRNGTRLEYTNPGFKEIKTKELYIDEVYRGRYSKEEKGDSYLVLVNPNVSGSGHGEASCYKTTTARAARKLLIEQFKPFSFETWLKNYTETGDPDNGSRNESE